MVSRKWKSARIIVHAPRRHWPPARRRALTSRPGHGFIETTDDGRLRVTRSGFPVLDAVVADLAA
jgi:hypothetical protein